MVLHYIERLKIIILTVDELNWIIWSCISSFASVLGCWNGLVICSRSGLTCKQFICIPRFLLDDHINAYGYLLAELGRFIPSTRGSPRKPVPLFYNIHKQDLFMSDSYLKVILWNHMDSRILIVWKYVKLKTIAFVPKYLNH